MKPFILLDPGHGGVINGIYQTPGKVSAQLSSEALLGLIDWEVPGHKIGEIILWSTGW